MRPILTTIYMLIVGVCIFFAGALYERQSHKCEVPEPKIRQMRVTAYCPCPKCCGEYADGVTASGHVIVVGDKFCAADKSIAFGTTISIPEYGEVQVLDRGGTIKGNRLDVYFPSHQEALNWGIKVLKVRIEK